MVQFGAGQGRYVAGRLCEYDWGRWIVTRFGIGGASCCSSRRGGCQRVPGFHANCASAAWRRRRSGCDWGISGNEAYAAGGVQPVQASITLHLATLEIAGGAPMARTPSAMPVPRPSAEIVSPQRPLGGAIRMRLPGPTGMAGLAPHPGSNMTAAASALLGSGGWWSGALGSGGGGSGAPRAGAPAGHGCPRGTADPATG